MQRHDTVQKEGITSSSPGMFLNMQGFRPFCGCIPYCLTVRWYLRPACDVETYTRV